MIHPVRPIRKPRLSKVTYTNGQINGQARTHTQVRLNPAPPPPPRPPRGEASAALWRVGTPGFGRIPHGREGSVLRCHLWGQDLCKNPWHLGRLFPRPQLVQCPTLMELPSEFLLLPKSASSLRAPPRTPVSPGLHIVTLGQTSLSADLIATGGQLQTRGSPRPSNPRTLLEGCLFHLYWPRPGDRLAGRCGEPSVFADLGPAPATTVLPAFTIKGPSRVD